MSKRRANNPAPEVSCSIRLNPSLKALLDDAASLHKQVRTQIAEKLSAFLEILGVPAKITVTIDSLDEATATANSFLGVTVNDNPCLYPNELLQQVHSYVTGTIVEPNLGPKQILERLNELTRTGKAGHQRIGEFLSLACLEVISRQPAAVLGYEQAVAYCASLPTPTNGDQSLPWPPDPIWLRPILQGVLDLRISIANKQAIVQVVHQSLKSSRSQQDVIEDLIEVLRPDVIEIQLPEEYLRQLVLADKDPEHNLFPEVRDNWFSMLGVHYPRFHFVIVENLKPNSCAFKLNHLTTLPYTVLTPDECLTSGTVADLKFLNIDGRSTIDPLNGLPCSIIESCKQSAAEAGGMVTLNQMSYLVRCLAVVVKEHGFCFIDGQYVRRELDKLETLLPKLVEAVRARIPLEQITRVLRSLVAEEICIRDLQSILELQLDYAYGIADSATEPNETGSDDATITSFVRTGLKCQITYKYARGQSVLSAYRLDPEIDEMLAAHEATSSREAKTIHLDEGKRKQILAAVQAQISHFSPTHNIPVIVSTIDGRHRLREIIAEQFPRLPVLAYQEISPHIELKPVSDQL